MWFFNGHMLIASEYCFDIVQARRHKKKRINKKWLKRYGMKKVPSKRLFVTDGRIYGHPTVINKIIEKAKLKGGKDNGC